MDLDVPPYPRLNYISGGAGKRGYVGNPAALASLNGFYRDVGLMMPQEARLKLSCDLAVQIDVMKDRPADLDNLIKTILDSFTRSGVWVDDRQIKRIEAELHKGKPPGFVVTVEPIL